MDALEISNPAQDQTGNVWKHLLTGIKASSFQSTWYLKGKLVFSLWTERDEHLENGWDWRSQLYFTLASQSFRNSFHDIADAWLMLLRLCGHMFIWAWIIAWSYIETLLKLNLKGSTVISEIDYRCSLLKFRSFGVLMCIKNAIHGKYTGGIATRHRDIPLSPGCVVTGEFYGQAPFPCTFRIRYKPWQKAAIAAY